MSFYGQVVKDFNNYPALVAKVAELLAKGDYVVCSSAMALRSPQLGTIPTSVQ